MTMQENGARKDFARGECTAMLNGPRPFSSTTTCLSPTRRTWNQKGRMLHRNAVFCGKASRNSTDGHAGLFSISYFGKYSIDVWKDELESICWSHGLATFIVHPDYVIERRARGVYENLLRHLSELCSLKNLWQPFPRDVARWWRERSRMRIERSGDTPGRCVGPGSDRARVAFAQIEHGQPDLPGLRTLLAGKLPQVDPRRDMHAYSSRCTHDPIPDLGLRGIFPEQVK